MKNKVQLITYADRLGGGDIKALHQLLKGPLAGLFGGVHILPFYYPIHGADAGFDPIDHTKIDPCLGSWDRYQGTGAGCGSDGGPDRQSCLLFLPTIPGLF